MISMELIKENIEKFICLEQIGFELLYAKKYNKLAIYPKEFKSTKQDIKNEQDIKNFFLSIPHLALYIEQISIKREKGKQRKFRYILSLDLPEDIMNTEIAKDFEESFAYYAAKIGYEINLDKQGNGFVLKRFETEMSQILSAIANAIIIYEYLCEKKKLCEKIKKVIKNKNQ